MTFYAIFEDDKLHTMFASESAMVDFLKDYYDTHGGVSHFELYEMDGEFYPLDKHEIIHDTSSGEW